jgi:hypothetical protein
MASQSTPFAHALSAHSTLQDTPLHCTSEAQELAPLQSTVFSAPKVFTSAQLWGPEQESRQSSPSHCTVPPHDPDPEHSRSSRCTLPPMPPRHERAPEHVMSHSPSQMTSAAQDSSPSHSTVHSPNAPHTTLFTHARLPQRTSQGPVAGHST